MDATLLESDTERAGGLPALVAEMREELSCLRREVAELRCDVGSWKSRHADAVDRNRKLQEELDHAHAEVRKLKAELFGRKSEKQSSRERSNDLDDPQDPATATKKHRGQQPNRPGPARRDDSHLPVREEFVALPPQTCVCDRCGKPLVEMGQTDDSEQVEVEQTVFRRRIRRRRDRKICNCPGPRTRTAPPPPKLIPKSRYGVSLWVHLLLEKFQAGRPIQRTIEQLGSFPADAQGWLIVDRDSAYKAMKQVQAGKLILVFCWAHVRRDFVRGGKGHPELKTWALNWLRQIRELYRLHRERRQHEPSVAEYASADAALREHVAAICRQRDAELADSKLRQPCRKALASLKEHWSGLSVFLDDPRIPLDNNFAERLMRNPAVGRKNSYGSAAEWAGRLAMMMFSIFARLTLWKINPRLWLTWYLESCAAAGGKTPGDIEPFLPWNLSSERRAALSGQTAPPEFTDTS